MMGREPGHRARQLVDVRSAPLRLRERRNQSGRARLPCNRPRFHSPNTWGTFTFFDSYFLRTSGFFPVLSFVVLPRTLAEFRLFR